MEKIEMSRRVFLTGASGTALLAGFAGHKTKALAEDVLPVNLARIAEVTSNTRASEGRLSAVNDDKAPLDAATRGNGFYPVWPHAAIDGKTSWLQYEWPKAVRFDHVSLMWAIDAQRKIAFEGSGFAGFTAPASYRFLFWNGAEFEPVKNAHSAEIKAAEFSETHFDAVTTNRLRIEVDPGARGAALLEWRVYSCGSQPLLPALVHAGLDRSVVLDAATYLHGEATWLRGARQNGVHWSKKSGPGAVQFDDASSAVTTARFAEPGEYVLQLAAEGVAPGEAVVHVKVVDTPPSERLDVVYTQPYAISSSFWKARTKALIVNWIPHCIRMCERTDIPRMRGDGGIDNFIEAAKANRGEAHGEHKGFVFSNAWVHQTVESMCIALMIDAEGDSEILSAQKMMHATLERWIPIILAAQMSDGYLQTAYTLADRKEWPERWSADHRGNHEGYVSGYFIESAINHYTLTNGRDLRLYEAAKRLADCWVAHLGPGKKAWFDGHQEMEQALVRFGRFVNDVEGNHRGDAYIALAKFLLDSRLGGSEYDQSHLPPGQQYEAVGHAVRAMYFYSGMADVAAETKDRDYQSAVISLWDNMVNRKYYVTGGIGSGETSEGFGPNYSLRNEAYCESCSSCGLIFFQYKLNLAYHDARYADLYEETIYNALLGSTDLAGTSFCYTNPLVNTERARWHFCPCCVANIARTLLMIPTWSYARSKEALYVNLYVGSRVQVGNVAGANVEVVQESNYPWDGRVSVIVNPSRAQRFKLHLRIPQRQTSALYENTPALKPPVLLKVNGVAEKIVLEKGYAVLERVWQSGDKVELELPMAVQVIRADERIEADRGRVALRYGPMVYCVESADNARIDQKIEMTSLKAEWRGDLLGGVMALCGQWQDGSPLTAIPYYARMNRVDHIDEYPDDERAAHRPVVSKVWI